MAETIINSNQVRSSGDTSSQTLLNENQIRAVGDTSSETLINRNQIASGNILYAPALDGTEQITTLSGQTSPTISDNQLVGGSGYLTQGWDNSGLWQLTFRAYATNVNTIDTGIILCPPTATDRDENEFMLTNGGSMYIYENSAQVGYDSSLQSILDTYQSWAEYTISKIAPDTIRIYWENGYVDMTWEALASYDRICIGVDKWSDNSMKIEQIKVEKL